MLQLQLSLSLSFFSLRFCSPPCSPPLPPLPFLFSFWTCQMSEKGPKGPWNPTQRAHYTAKTEILRWGWRCWQQLEIKRGSLANTGSSFKEMGGMRGRENEWSNSKLRQAAALNPPSFVFLRFFFFFERAPKRKRQRRRRSECWYDYVNVNRISCRLEAVFLSDPFSLQIFHLRRIPPGRLLRRYLTG